MWKCRGRQLPQSLSAGTTTARLVGSEIHDNPGTALADWAGAAPVITQNVFRRNGMSQRTSGTFTIEKGAVPLFQRNVFVGMGPEVFTAFDRPGRAKLKKRELVHEASAAMTTIFNRLGPYEIVREIGRGGMAMVFLARDTRTSHEVALKLVPHGIDREAREILEAEQWGAELQRQFSQISRHVPAVYEQRLERVGLFPRRDGIPRRRKPV